MACGFDSTEAVFKELSNHQQEESKPGSDAFKKTDKEFSVLYFSSLKGPMRYFTREQCNEISDLDEQIKTLSDVFTERLDVVEQMLKYRNVLIHGVQEDFNEELDQVVLDIFQGKMHMKVALTDIEKCYRTGDMFPRSIVVKFSSCQKKYEVMKQKHHLKGTYIDIREDLCPGTEKLLKDAEKQFGERNVCYKNGVFLIYRPPGRQQLLFKTRSELRKYIETHSGFF